MIDHKEVYGRHGERYDRLVAREDYQGNILRALEGIHPLAGQTVVESGAGTGRLTRLLAPVVEEIWLFDVSQHMLEVACRTLRGRNWRAAVADHRDLPLKDGSADVVISGWSVCCLAVWSESEWQREVERAVREMTRVLGSEGTIILLETLGTGHERPHAPEKLRDYFDYLEDSGFVRQWIRTDFEFESLEEAKELMGFFFGDEMAARVEEKNWVRLPECTGTWWKRV